MTKPTLFIGSSVEGLPVARAIRSELRYDADVTVWNQADFVLGNSTLESLEEMLQQYDFAVMVFTADDSTQSRGHTSFSPRDNVVFELGLFMGYLGRRRTFVVYDKEKLPKIPSDLAGITLATYDGTRVAINAKAAVADATDAIREVIKKLGLFNSQDAVDMAIENLKLKEEIDLSRRKLANCPQICLLDEFTLLEKGAEKEVWILRPEGPIEHDSFYEVVQFNVQRGISYQYIVPTNHKYKAELETLKRRIGYDNMPITRGEIKVKNSSLSLLPGPIVIIDPLHQSPRGFFIAENKLSRREHSWVELPADNVSKYVTGIQRILARKP